MLQRGGVLLRLERWWAGVPPPSTLQLGFATAAFAVVFKLAMLVRHTSGIQSSRCQPGWDRVAVCGPIECLLRWLCFCCLAESIQAAGPRSGACAASMYGRAG